MVAILFEHNLYAVWFSLEMQLLPVVGSTAWRFACLLRYRCIRCVAARQRPFLFLDSFVIACFCIYFFTELASN
jgi:hypothetical protein